MRILGIDPGYAIVGYGVVDYKSNRFTTVDYGAVLTDAKMEFSERLLKIYRDITAEIVKFKPDAMSVERLYFTTNQTTAIAVAEARGVILLAAAENMVPIYEYTPLQVKQSVVGYGKAEKKQVMAMTQRILSLGSVPKPDDTADALAIAICHAHSAGSSLMDIVRKAGAR